MAYVDCCKGWVAFAAHKEGSATAPHCQRLGEAICRRYCKELALGIAEGLQLCELQPQVRFTSETWLGKM